MIATETNVLNSIFSCHQLELHQAIRLPSSEFKTLKILVFQWVVHAVFRGIGNLFGEMTTTLLLVLSLTKKAKLSEMISRKICSHLIGNIVVV